MSGQIVVNVSYIGKIKAALKEAESDRDRWKYVAQWTVIQEGQQKGMICWRGTKWVDTLLADYDKKEKSRRAAR